MLKLNLVNFIHPRKTPQDYRQNPEYQRYKRDFSRTDTFEKQDENHANVSHYFKKRFYDKSEINSIVSCLEEKDKFIGSLPLSWLKNIEKDKIGEKTLEIGEILSNFSKTMYNSLECNKKDYPKASKALADVLSETLEQPFKVKYYSEGHVGKVFLIKTKDEICALKIFHTKPRHDLERRHGINIEVTNALYLNSTMKKNQCAKFYFGKLGSAIKGDSFLLTKFVESKKNTSRRANIEPEPYKLTRIVTEDYSYSNVINNKIVDFGGLDYCFKSYNQKELAKQLLPAFKDESIEEVKKIGEKCEYSQDYQQLIKIFETYIVKKGDFKKELIELERSFIF